MTLNNQDLTNKVALVTGSAGGIGLAIAQTYLENGAKVVLTDYQQETPAALAPLLADYNASAFYLGCDIRDGHAVDSLISHTIESFGQLDILVNNAAVFDLAPILESDEDSFDRLFDINVKACFFTLQKVAKKMVDMGTQGRIINMASQAGRRGEALVSHYCATKAAVISYTQSAALGLAEQIAVGKAVPLGYMGKPNEVASMALFLASEGAKYITAQTFNVDGGNVMS